MKRVLDREEFLRYKNLQTIQKIDEVLANEINWGDSLVGRLINSIGRKGRIGWNLRKIGDKKKGLIGQLNAQFAIIKDSVQLGLSSDDQRFLTTMELLKELENMVDNEADIDDMVDHIDYMIWQVGTYNLKDRDVMVKALEDFKAYLLGLTSEEEGEEEGEEDDEELTKLDSEVYFKNLEILAYLIKNIGEVKLESEDEGEGESEEGESEEEESEIKRKLQHPNIVVYKRANGEINKAIVAQTPIKKNPDTGEEYVQLIPASDKMINEQSSFGVPIDSVVKVLPPVKKGSVIGFKKDGKAVKGRVLLSKRGIMTLELENGDKHELSFKEDFTVLKTPKKSVNESVVSSKDSHASQALVSLRKSIKILTNEKDKGLSVSSELISSILKYRGEEDIQEMVEKLYQLVWSFLFGKRKGTLNPNTKPIFENFIQEYRIDVKNGYGVGKLEVLAQKIARFSYKCLQFDNNESPLSMKSENEHIAAPYGDYGKKVVEFNSSLKQILVYFSKVSKKNKEEKVEERVLSYQKFRLFEATDGVNYSDVKIKFEEIFNPRVKGMFDLSQETVERLKNLQTTGRMVLRTPDPIIEIVRIFHRAWRLHTPGVIPSGRTGGKVSNSVFREYEYMGEGSGGTPESPGSGPYRNIKLWDAWNDGVMDILNDTDYRNTIFSDKCEFMFEDTRDKPEVRPGEGVNKDNLGEKLVNEAQDAKEAQAQNPPKSGETTKRPLGKILLRFVNRLLADGKMYKKGGALPSFMDEYFDLDSKYLSKEISKMPGAKDDIKKNQKVVEGIVKTQVFFQDYSKVEKSFKEESNIFGYLRDNKEKPPVGLCFRMKSEKGGKDDWNYFILQKKYSGSLFFLYTKGMPYKFDTLTVSDPSGRELSSSNASHNVAMYFGEGKFGYIGMDGEIKPGNVSMDNSSVQVLTKKDGKAYLKVKPLKKVDIKESYMDKLLEMSGKSL